MSTILRDDIRRVKVDRSPRSCTLRSTMARLAGILAVFFFGCAQGGAEDAPAAASDAGRDSTTLSFDGGSDAPMIEEAPADAPPGAIFDVLEDAPCTEGSKTACKTSCGTLGDVTCVTGDWGKCTPRPGDPCLGLDCLGKGDGYEHTWYRDSDDDGHGDAKASSQACVAPRGYFPLGHDCNDRSKAAYPGATEICDGIDNDCNGKIDELAKVGTFDMPFSSLPPCATSDMASCKRGAYDWCRAKSSCFTGGFGPVELGPSNGVFVCVGDGTLTSGWADVVAAQPACSDDSLAGRRVCESAVHRAGRTKGFASAILQTHAPSDWKFLGLPSSRAQAFDGLVWSDLSSKHAGCTLGAVDTYDCNAATHRYCTSKGFVSGYGPVEYNTVNVSVVCVK